MLIVRWKMRVEGDFVFGKLNSAGYTILLLQQGVCKDSGWWIKWVYLRSEDGDSVGLNPIEV